MKYIKFPNELTLINRQDKTLVCYINGTCGFCLDKLPYWKEYLITNNLMEKSDLSLMFILYSDNYKLFEFVNNAKINFPLQFLYDSTDSYRRLNNIEFGSELNTVLINKNNEILYSGNPLNNDESFKRALN
jgi:hypothetical protein